MTLPWRSDTTPDIAAEVDSRYETPGGAQNKVDVSAETINRRVDNIVAYGGESNIEIVDSRQPSTGSAFPTLRARLNNSDLQKANAADLQSKADRSELLVKADKSQLELKADKSSLLSKADVTYVDNKVGMIVSGSPKGVYPSLAALNAAFPTGNNNIYVVSADGSWYYWSGTTWTLGGTYQSTEVADGSVSENKLSFTAVPGIPSKNLFNKKTVQLDHYVLWSNGAVDAATGYSASDWIKVSPSTTYTKNEPQQMAFYDSLKTYISGLSVATTFTTPSNAAYVRITVETVNLDTTQLERGTDQTTYESYVAKVSIDSLPREYTQDYGNMVVVAKSGAYYTTINNALANASDTPSNPVTILLMPGIYVESVNLIGRYVSIVGVNKETCIIKTYTNDYYHPPIDLSSNAHLSNLTIIADDDGSTTPPGGVGGLSAYAVHHDIAGRYDPNLIKHQGVSRVTNCILISKHNHGAGIGLCNKQTLIFEDCEFVAYGFPAFRAHNFIGSGAIQQQLIVRDCIMHNDGTTPSIVLQDANHGTGGAGGNTDTVFSFVRNVSYSESGGLANSVLPDPPQATGCVAGYIKLGVGSFGNSSNLLNK